GALPSRESRTTRRRFPPGRVPLLIGDVLFQIRASGLRREPGRAPWWGVVTFCSKYARAVYAASRVGRRGGAWCRSVLNTRGRFTPRARRPVGVGRPAEEKCYHPATFTRRGCIW